MLQDEIKKYLDQLYQGRVREFDSLNKINIKGGIAFVGDSIFEGYNVYEYFGTKTVYNRGISGDTTKGVLKRLKSSVYDLIPSKVILLIGTNDFAEGVQSPKTIVVTMEEIVRNIRQECPRTQIILCSILPVNPSMNAESVLPRNNQLIEETNHSLKKIPGVVYLDLYHGLLKDQVLDPKFSTEGLHLNGNGYRVLTDLITRFIE